MIVTYVFPLLFTDGVLNEVAGHEIYCFLDGFSGYNQIRMHPDEQEKTMFVTDWGVFVAIVMMFGRKTAPATFQRLIREIFGEYIPAVMQVFLEDFTVYRTWRKHLQLCLERCQTARLSLNLAKRTFWSNKWRLGHIVSSNGIALTLERLRP